MLADLSASLARQALRLLPPDRPHGRADLDRLPPVLARRLRQRLSREATARLSEAAAWLSDDPEAWQAAQSGRARFPAEAWAPALREACDEVLRAVVAPADALPEIAVGEGERPAPEAVGALRETGVYPYLAEIAARYVDKKGIETVTAEDLGDLLGRIERRVADELDAEGWVTLLGPLYDLVAFAPEHEGAVPGMVLSEAFAARGAPGLGAAVVDHRELDRDALLRVLEQAIAPEEAIVPEEVDPAPEAESAASGETEDGDASGEQEGESAPDPEASGDPDSEGDDASPEADPDATEPEAVETPEAVAPEPETAAPADPEPEPGPDEAPQEVSHVEASGDAEGDADVGAEGDTDVEPPDDESLAAFFVARETISPLDAPVTPLAADPHTAGPDAEAPEASGEEAAATTEPEAPEPAAPEGSDDEPLWARLARQQGADPMAEPDDAPDHEPLWERFASGGRAEPTGAEAPPEPADPDAVEARVLGANADQRELYVAKLFDGDEADYHRVLGALGRCTSWTEATQVIGQDVFVRYKVNIYSDPAKSFTDAVERRFRPASGDGTA